MDMHKGQRVRARGKRPPQQNRIKDVTYTRSKLTVSWPSVRARDRQARGEAARANERGAAHAGEWWRRRGSGGGEGESGR
eukprot:3071321-Pleurochrysis_carterae.AAC.1